MDEHAVAGYLARIEVSRPAVIDADALAYLHRAHQMTVPFENLGIHLGEQISLDEADLLAKIVTRRRGGFCYELNGAFALLLEALGAQVTRVAAAVWTDGKLGYPFAHLALIVRPQDGSGPWLADVGFGRHSSGPLLLTDAGLQQDPGGTFRLAGAEHGDIDVFRDGEPQYRVDQRPRELRDFVPACWWQATSPLSHFTQGLICSRLTETGRITLSGATLVTTAGPQRAEQRLPCDDAILAAYRDHFSITLDRVPASGPTNARGAES